MAFGAEYLLFQTQNLITSYSVVSSWIPIAILGVITGLLVISIVYIIGAIANSSKIKNIARLEYYQLLYTLIIIIITTWFISSILSKVFSSILSPSQINEYFIQYLSNSPFGLINQTSNEFIAMESIINPNGNVPDPSTAAIDYGLATTYFIVANVTNQEMNNFNALYIFSGLVSFFSQLTPTFALCIGETCEIQGLESQADIFITARERVFAGYSLLDTMLKPIIVQAILMNYLLIAELILLGAIVYIWPFLLGVGIFLRSLPVFRRIGGLFIGFAIGLISILPLTYMIEFVSFSNNQLSPIGANSLPSMTIYQKQVNTNNIYTFNAINMFILPNDTQIENYYGCWPIDGNLLLEEVKDAATFLLPVTFPLTALFSVVNLVNTFGGIIISGCGPENALNTVFTLAHAYGYTAIAGLLIPLFNIILTISGSIGISSLIGGETNLGPLSRLI